jgi:hypothetical protein
MKFWNSDEKYNFRLWFCGWLSIHAASIFTDKSEGSMFLQNAGINHKSAEHNPETTTQTYTTMKISDDAPIMRVFIIHRDGSSSTRRRNMGSKLENTELIMFLPQIFV